MACYRKANCNVVISDSFEVSMLSYWNRHSRSLFCSLCLTRSVWSVVSILPINVCDAVSHLLQCLFMFWRNDCYWHSVVADMWTWWYLCCALCNHDLSIASCKDNVCSGAVLVDRLDWVVNPFSVITDITMRTVVHLHSKVTIKEWRPVILKTW